MTHIPNFSVPRSVLRRVSLVLVAVALVAATACNPSETPRVRAAQVFKTHACEVGVIGDSLTVGARDFGALASKFQAAGCSVRNIDARVGRPTSEGANIAEAWARANQMPRVLVVALGTNDCDRASFTRHARRILAAAGPNRPVVWVNTWRPGCDERINNALFDIQKHELNKRADMGNLWILNHWSWVHGNRSVLGRDGLHLTQAGYNAHASRIVQAVNNGLQ